jgi:phage tail protein X
MALPKEYLAPQGTVWDQISYKFYGDERFINALLEANPSLRHIVRFEKSTLIIIPPRPEVPSDSVSRLPPWKQAG